ncbi:hypothetical protein GGS23DRAFT_612275 [Durotheca rogersii]|uniref:uncharacterized protein n=1 Tax=Durotheca rogersii TaxID=419775 RepID=UPI00222127A6|nr:uncharacterized protein GGS23DRAFT_612275 [Durotheca rogersii]KAI5867171.1 hypothetical protein GGS23DRAFT_612275 [Durotheca rogersii]
MATAYTIRIAPDNTGLCKVRQDESTAKAASDLLQDDLEKHHVFFNPRGFHNHISHHILSLYGTGASSEDMKKGFDGNKSYQRPAFEAHREVIEGLKDWEVAKGRLANELHYPDFLAFFQKEIERLGWQQVLKEYVFNGDTKSEDMMLRMFSGELVGQTAMPRYMLPKGCPDWKLTASPALLHSLIQLMYGVEWEQPAMVAMGLAQAAVHRDSLRAFLLGAEEAAKSNPDPMPSIVSLLEEIRSNKTVAAAVEKAGIDEIRQGVLEGTWDETIAIASRVKIKPEELDERTAEMYDSTIYASAAAAFRPGKYPKFDFILMHHVNVNPIFLVINRQDWIPIESKVRLLEWKIRIDIAHYVNRGCPPLSLENVASYVPTDKSIGPADAQLPRVHALDDDGHAIKLFRALILGRELSEKYGDRDWANVKGDCLWTRLIHLMVDSAESPGPRWIRSKMLGASWAFIPDLP